MLARYRIRPYTPQDQEAVWTLVADTAFFGDPVEAFLEDRALYCALFAAYYTDYEPERLWVAETNGVVFGYVMGCGDSHRRLQIFLTRILPGVVGGVLRHRYTIGRKALTYASHALQEVFAGRHLTAITAQFPGHLHIGVAASARGQGIGRALLETSLRQFWTTGVRGVHLVTTDRNQVACHLYESVGFRLLNAYPTRLWNGFVKGVQTRVYGIKPQWQCEAAVAL
jgi:ribosomal protein S18 acetylase RimI-like enzyme